MSSNIQSHFYTMLIMALLLGLLLLGVSFPLFEGIFFILAFVVAYAAIRNGVISWLEHQW